MHVNYLTPKAEVANHGEPGPGAVAIEPIAAGETVAAFGGWVVTRAELDRFPPERRSRSIQIDEDLFLASSEFGEPGDRVNHSCEPNCAMFGSQIVVAMRDIDVGEPITYDYAMSDGSDYDEFACQCGARTCRGTVRGTDWQRPDLQERYAGHFSPYLARRIADQSTPPDAVRRPL